MSFQLFCDSGANHALVQCSSIRRLGASSLRHLTSHGAVLYAFVCINILSFWRITECCSGT
ncbi:hypothetical protein I7I48_04923 [Histoplasma ohiense]|nr:hypothetical protein I7I48_04923 [Histoplasma ohiense (nom. inval.)]